MPVSLCSRKVVFLWCSFQLIPLLFLGGQQWIRFSFVHTTSSSIVLIQVLIPFSRLPEHWSPDFFFCRQRFPLLFPDPCKLGAVFCLLLLISSFIARGGMPSTHFSFGLGIGLHPAFSNATGFGSDLALLLQLDLNPSSFLCSFECVHEPNQSSLCSV
jgi:hypothetical protein